MIDLLKDVGHALYIIDNGGTPEDIAFAKQVAAKFGWHDIDWAFPANSPTGYEPALRSEV